MIKILNQINRVQTPFKIRTLGLFLRDRNETICYHLKLFYICISNFLPFSARISLPMEKLKLWLHWWMFRFAVSIICHNFLTLGSHLNSSGKINFSQKSQAVCSRQPIKKITKKGCLRNRTKNLFGTFSVSLEWCKVLQERRHLKSVQKNCLKRLFSSSLSFPCCFAFRRILQKSKNSYF